MIEGKVRKGKERGKMLAIWVREDRWGNGDEGERR